MGTGYLMVQCKTADDALPVDNARVTLKNPNGAALYETYTNANGKTDILPLPAPGAEYTLDPNFFRPAYSSWDVDVEKKGFVTAHIHGVEVVDTQTSILPVNMLPLVDEPFRQTDVDIDIPPIGLLIPDVYPLESWSVSPFRQVVIPDDITVHLGTPTNASARNVRVRFPEYIKNVVSSEIYSTWPQNSLITNIHVVVTFALNRVYTEWYRSRGFAFDITNSTAYDQYYRDGAQIFENISKLVDELFHIYARREHFRNPFFTAFCNGTVTTCEGLSQWGTVELANRGMMPLEILRYYYPDDLMLTTSDNIAGITESYPGYPLQRGSQGEAVNRMQRDLNRIRVNYPLIPLISNPNGTFDAETENAVRTFQSTFNQTADGIVGPATWNKITFIFNGVTRLGEMNSEGERESIGENPPNMVLQQGSQGEHVLKLQFILNSIAPYYNTVPPVIQDGVFNASGKNAVIQFQNTFGLVSDGIVGSGTWNKLYAVYHGIQKNVQIPPVETPPSIVYPGTPLLLGSSGPEVRLMQTYLNTIRIVYPSIPAVEVNGTFDEATRDAVIAFQDLFLLAPNGVIDPDVWDYIVTQYQLVTGGEAVSLAYPGVLLRPGSAGSSVRLMQQFLSELHGHSPEIPAITVDGIFDRNTETAVIAFQRLFDLVPDGIIGPATWYAIIYQRNSAV